MQVLGIEIAGPLNDLAKNDRLSVAGQRQPDPVYIGASPDVTVADPGAHGMLVSARRDDAACALMPVLAMMRNPLLAQHEAPETTAPGSEFLAFVPIAVMTPRRIRRILPKCERVGRRPDTDDRFAGPEKIVDELHLFVGQRNEAREDHHQMRAVQMLQTGNYDRRHRVDDARGVRMLGEQYRGAKAVGGREDPCKLRQRLLGPVLLIAGQQHDVIFGVFAVPFVGQPRLRERNTR